MKAMCKLLKRKLKQVHPLFLLGKYLALLPPYNSKTGRFSDSAFYRWYSALLLAILSSLFVTSQMVKVTYHYPVHGTAITVVASITFYWLFAMTCSSVVRLMFLKLNTINKFLQNLCYVDLHLRRFDVCALPKYIDQYLVMIFSQAFLISLIVYDHSIWFRTTGLYDVLSAIHESFLIIRMSLLVILMCGFVQMIELRYRRFNKLLGALIGASASEKLARFALVVNADRIFKINSVLCDLVDLFNELFGWEILFVMVQVCVTILMFIAIAISSSLELVLNTILWTGFLMVLGIMVIRSCNRVNDERQKTIAIAHKLLYEVHYFRSPNDLVTRELVAFTQEVSARRTQFSAAGFFEVDYRLLHSLVTFVASYVVVIIQFQSSPKHQSDSFCNTSMT